MNMIGQALDGRYQVIELLAAGGFGQTYIAIDTKRPKSPKCVVKQLRLEHPDPQTVKVARRLFQTEAETLDVLGQHDQIPRLFAYFEFNAEFYLVQELIEGHSLAAEFENGQRFSEVHVKAFLIEALEILDYVHSKGVIHRDIKPANFLRRASDSKLVLIDFGAVKEVATQVVNSVGQVTATVAIGTPGYMAIEQFQSNPQFNSDIYSLGMMAIQALTGIESVALSSLRDPKNPSAGEMLWRDQVNISPELADVIDRMVKTNFRERYPDARSALADLRKNDASGHRRDVPTTIQTPLAAGSLQPNVQETTIQRPQSSKKPWKLFAAAALLAIGLSGGGWWMSHKNGIEAKELYQTALAKYQQDDPRGAIEDLNRSIKLDSGNGLAYYQRGLALGDEGKPEQAFEDFSRAIELLPPGRTVGGGIGITFSLDEESQIPSVVTVRAKSPADKAGIQPQDQIVEIEGNSTKGLALQEISKLLQGEPGSKVSLKLAGQSEQQLTRIGSPNIELGAAYFQRGLLNLQMERFKEANEDASKALEIDTENFFYYFVRGSARSRLADKQGAVQDFTKGIALNPESPFLYLERGRIYRFLGQADAAIQDFEKAIALNPDDIFTHYEQCLTLALTDKFQDALATCNTAIEIDPKFSGAYLIRGNVYQKLQQNDAAFADFARVIELDPNSAEAYSNRGILRDKSGDAQGAIADFTQAIRLNPKGSESYNNRGKVRTQLKDYKGALQDFNLAIENLPTNAGAHFNRASVYVGLRQPKNAIEDYRKSADLFLEQKRLREYQTAIDAIKQLEELSKQSS